MFSVIASPEASFSLQSRPNRLVQLWWTNPVTNRVLLEAGVTVIPTHQDTTHHREFANDRSIPRVCETGPTVGRDTTALKVNVLISNATSSPGTCSTLTTMISGSSNDPFPGATHTLINDGTYRSRASVSRITGAHVAKFGYEGAYFARKVRNEVNDLRLTYHYATPPTTGGANCLSAANQAVNPYACGNMTLYYASEDPFNTIFLRPRPVGFQMNTGVGAIDERVWYGGLYAQDQWTLGRVTLSGAIRYDRAGSRYGSTCIGPDRFVGLQEPATVGTSSWCSEPSEGVRYGDVTPRWGAAWDVFGTGKTAVRWHMGQYLQAAGFHGLYTDDNPARRSTNSLTRAWDDRNGNRVVECVFENPSPHTHPSGDVCGSMVVTFGPTAGQPTVAWQQFGRAPDASQFSNFNSICGRTANSSPLHRDYCEASGQDLTSGRGVRRNEWQLSLGVQHELLPRLSVEATYNRKTYGNLTTSDILGRGCDYFIIDPVVQLSVSEPQSCVGRYLAFEATPFYDFFRFEAPVDSRLPGGGGYVIRGLSDSSTFGALPNLGTVTTIQDALEYTWDGVDTHVAYRGPGGWRVSGGSSTGRVRRDTCRAELDAPNAKGREGNLYGGGCAIDLPYRTNIRGSASYTIPWVDVLVGAVFQRRPGVPRSAILTGVSSEDVVWEPSSAGRATVSCNPGFPGPGCFFGGGVPSTTVPGGVDLLDAGDLSGESISLWDLNLQKQIRFGGRRVRAGVQIYNLLNSDAATGYDDSYTAFRLADGTWVEDNPNTAGIVEENGWGSVTQIVAPRFLRFSVEFDF